MELAKLNKLKPWQQEKHYIQAIILEILAEHPLVFKGGTYLWFFHGLPRFSEDLDFTAKEKLPENLPEVVSKSLELFGVQNKVKIIANNEASISFRISAKGPLNTAEIDECRVYVEISRRENVETKRIPVKLDFPAYSLPIKTMSGMSLEEIVAEKLRAIITRSKSRDVYDLYYLIGKNVAFNQALANKKLEYYHVKFSKKDLLAKIMADKKRFEKELGNLVFDELPDFACVLRKIKKWLLENKH